MLTSDQEKYLILCHLSAGLDSNLLEEYGGVEASMSIYGSVVRLELGDKTTYYKITLSESGIGQYEEPAHAGLDLR